MGYLARSFSLQSAVRTGRRRRRYPVVAFMSLLLALLVFGASEVAAKSWTYDLAGDLMSPYCPGRTLSSCPSPQAAELVQWIAVQEAGGATREQVIEMLIERFGEGILGAPPAKGITLWAYLLPILGFVGGGGLVVVALRRLVARGAAPDSTWEAGEGARGSQVDDDLAKRVDADLAARS